MRETMALLQQESYMNAHQPEFNRYPTLESMIPSVKITAEKKNSPLLLNSGEDLTSSSSETDFVYIPRFVKLWRWGYNWAVYLFLSSSSTPGVSFHEAEKKEYYYS